MESKALFDLDHSFAPGLRIEINPSSDVRDKVAAMFIDSLGSSSQWCSILRISEKEYLISPLGIHDLKAHAEAMLKKANEYERSTSQAE